MNVTGVFAATIHSSNEDHIRSSAVQLRSSHSTTTGSDDINEDVKVSAGFSTDGQDVAILETSSGQEIENTAEAETNSESGAVEVVSDSVGNAVANSVDSTSTNSVDSTSTTISVDGSVDEEVTSSIDETAISSADQTTTNSVGESTLRSVADEPATNSLDKTTTNSVADEIEPSSLGETATNSVDTKTNSVADGADIKSVKRLPPSSFSHQADEDEDFDFLDDYHAHYNADVNLEVPAGGSDEIMRVIMDKVEAIDNPGKAAGEEGPRHTKHGFNPYRSTEDLRHDQYSFQ